VRSERERETEREKERFVLFRVFDTNYPSLPILPQDYSFSRSPSAQETRFSRDAKSLNGFRYRIFRTTRFATCKFGVFSTRRSLGTARRSELGLQAHGILPVVTRYRVRIVVIYIIRIDLSLAAYARHTLSTQMM